MAASGFLLDVYYTDATGSEHTFLLDVNCRLMKWKLYDDRLGLQMGGEHGPPGIDVPGGITGTAFWRDDRTMTYFLLRDFLSIPFFPDKYRVGQSGAGVFVNVPEGYKHIIGSKDLKWVVGNP